MSPPYSWLDSLLSCSLKGKLPCLLIGKQTLASAVTGLVETGEVATALTPGSRARAGADSLRCLIAVLLFLLAPTAGAFRL